MTRDDIFKFGRADKKYMTDIYQHLDEEDKIFLWLDLLTFDFKSGFPEIDPLAKFTPENYKKWKSEEPEFDRFLDYIIDEYMPAWNIPYKGWQDHDFKTELYIRLGKIKQENNDSQKTN
jgi:hypothetical protein